MLVSPVRDPVHLPAGEGPAVARLPAGPWVALPLAAGAAAAEEGWIEVRAGEAEVLACPDPPPGILRGEVRGAGLPLAGLRVELRRTDRHRELAHLAETRTDELGRFAFDAAHAGHGYVMVLRERERLATRAVEVVPGQELWVEIEVDPPAAAAVVVFAEPGGELLDVLGLEVASWSEGQGWPARALEDGAWAVPGGLGRSLLAARTVLHAHKGGGYSDAYLFGEAKLGPGVNRVEAYPGTLRVEFGEQDHRHAPIAFLESVDGLDAALLTWGRPLNLARERLSAGVYEFRSVPPHAQVLLWSQGEDGRPIRRRVEIQGGAPTRVTW